MTDLKTLLGWDIRTDQRQVHPLLRLRGAAARLHRAVRAGSSISKLGTLLLAMRDKEDRVRFSGYDVAKFKVFVFCLAAALSRHRRRACSRCRSASCRRRFVGIVPSIEMVIFAAVGGRMSLVGAVYGALLVNFGKTALLRELPGTLAVPDGGAVHRRGDGLPERPGRAVREPRRAVVDAAERRRASPAAGAATGRTLSPRRRRRTAAGIRSQQA